MRQKAPRGSNRRKRLNNARSPRGRTHHEGRTLNEETARSLRSGNVRTSNYEAYEESYDEY